MQGSSFPAVIVPEGLSQEKATADQLEQILANPRCDVEQYEWDRLGKPTIPFLLDRTYPAVILLHDRPIAYFSLHHIGGFVEYRCLGTPAVDRYKLFLTKMTRRFVEWGVLQYPRWTHVSGCFDEPRFVGWLRLVGFEPADLVPFNGVDMRRMVWPS